MGMSFTVAGDWEAMDDENNHRLRLVRHNGEIVGGVLRHNVKGTEGTECEPGLIQWEPIAGVPRPLFERNEQRGEPLSLTPFIRCEICGDAGWIIKGQWRPKDDDEGIDSVAPMRVLQGTEGNDEDTFTFEEAVRRDLGDKVPAEERDADRKLYDMHGGKDTIIPPDPQYDIDPDPEMEALLAEEEEIEAAARRVMGTYPTIKEEEPISSEVLRRRAGIADVVAKSARDLHEEIDAIVGGSLPSEQAESLRKKLLDEALGLITGDRNNQYGPPHQDFQRTADMVTAMWGDKLKDGVRIEAHDVAEFVICIKLSRLQWTPEKRDNWTDIVGYAGCGYEAFRLTHPEIEEK